MRVVGKVWVRLRAATGCLFCLMAAAGASPLHGLVFQPVQSSSPGSLPVLGQAPVDTDPVDSGANPDSSKTVKVKHPTVETIPLASRTTVVGRKSSYLFKVGSNNWMDTGVALNAGDHVEWSASGTLKISDGREATPEGVARGWKDLIRQFPVNSANTGAVVARVGDAESVPFLVGEKKDIQLEQGGHLFLAANLSPDLTATGEFEVKVKLLSSKPEGAAAAKASDGKLLPGSTGTASRAGSGPEATELQSDLSPALFAKIPRRVGDERGNLGDMVNFSMIGTEDQVLKAFKAAGWTQVDKTTQEAVLHGVLATLAHEVYVEMPMSTLYLFGRPQDLSYARAAPLEVAAIRHHLRAWKTDKMIDDKPMWVGSATHDNGFEKDQRTGGVTHHIDANVDEERDFIEKSFAAAGVIEAAAYVLPENPLQTATTATGGTFQSDGRVLVMELK